MKRISIRNHHTTRPFPPRFCDMVIQEDVPYLEVRYGKEIRTILLEDLLRQIWYALNVDIQET